MSETASLTPEILPFGPDGVVLRLGLSPDERVVAAVQVLRAALENAALPGVEEIAASLTSVLVRFDPQLGERSPVLGLILEQATDTLRLPAEAFKASGLEASQPGYLGPLQRDARGMIQRIEVGGLLDDAMRALLFQPPAQG